MLFFFFQAEDGIRDIGVTGVQTCALPISRSRRQRGGYEGAQRGVSRAARRGDPEQVRLTTTASGARRASGLRKGGSPRGWHLWPVAERALVPGAGFDVAAAGSL